ncbi:MAG: hypothetical protein CM15mP12_4920 [Gammaproteobacteria bacterium]|nr:MAG: hypothetical protein CM15mP12_4920 [Gammaproteobacteria bacterium]
MKLLKNTDRTDVLQERISFADDLIFNDGSLETFLAKLDFYYKLYDKLA